MKFGETIYYCKAIRDEEGNLTGYEDPKPIILRPRYFSLMPTSGYSEIVVYGRDIKVNYTAYALYSAWGDTFKEGDKFYVDGHKPTAEEDEPGDKANAEIDNVRYDNFYVKLIIKKLAVV